MIFQLEYMVDPNILVFHTDKIFTTNFADIYKGETYNEDNQPDYIKKLWKVDGVDKIVPFRFQINITKGEIFEWTEEVIEKIILILLNEFEPVLGVATEKAHPVKWSYDDETKRWYKPDPKKSSKKLRVFTLIKVAERKRERKKKIIDPDMPPESEPPK